MSAPSSRRVFGPRLAERDPEIAAAIRAEETRQSRGLELIASENFASDAVMEATGSVMTNKYAEGYPGRRYYGGCVHVDEAERLARNRAKKLFGAQYANVQPHSGSQANMVAYLAVLDPGDAFLGMALDQGGHLTHGHPLNFSGQSYRPVAYGVRRGDERLDLDELRRLAREHRPKMIMVGASAYPRLFPGPEIREIADEVGAKVVTDMAHIAGLVAGGVIPNPLPYSDIVTTTTHKTLRGPRGGLILWNEKGYGKALNRITFPGIQGGPMMHAIAAKAVCFREALDPSFAAYARQIVTNAKQLAASLASLGFRLVSGGYRQPPRPARCPLPRGDRARRRGCPRGRRNHRQQEHDPLRPRKADDRQRHPAGNRGADHPGDAGGRDGRGGPAAGCGAWFGG